MDKPIIIEGKKYKLIKRDNNSSPCAGCAFFNISKLMCEHPDFPNRHCEQNPGTYKGWQTIEYQIWERLPLP